LLEPVLALLIKYVNDPRFGETVCDVGSLVLGMCNPHYPRFSSNVVSEMYSPVLGQSPLIDALFLRLRKKVTAELRFQQELIRTKGALDMIFASLALTGV
jgi:U3 small nucleolar RNA-associated protein 15